MKISMYSVKEFVLGIQMTESTMSEEELVAFGRQFISEEGYFKKEFDIIESIHYMKDTKKDVWNIDFMNSIEIIKL